jgi:type I restriction enzyme S subunit
MKSKLSNLCTFTDGRVAIADLDLDTYISTENMLPDKGGISRSAGLPTVAQTQAYQAEDVLISNIRPYFRKIWFADRNGGCSNDVLVLRTSKGVYPHFLYYLLSDDKFFDYATTTAKGTKMPRGDKVAIMQYDVPVLPLPAQRAIAEVLSSLDDKIDLLTRQNATLEALAQTYFRQWFVEEASDDWEIGKAEDYFEIGIGKTPPRQEHHWFSSNSDNSDNMVWVSIADMGKSGLFIGDSSEYLTKEAVEQFNIRRVPKGAILLSFKLTVGRLAITLCELTTNEAIAHFKYKNDYEKEYLYCYLKAFDYYSLGSTSSIATAVNSQIIKAMPFVMPETVTLKKYHELIAPFFTKIENNTRQIHILQKLRDTLLPKLISGEVSIKQ